MMVLTRCRFLSEWASLPLLAKGPRLRLLQSLQVLTEVDEFLKAHPDTNPFGSPLLVSSKLTRRTPEAPVVASKPLSKSAPAGGGGLACCCARSLCS
jgi:hypothetical protein